MFACNYIQEFLFRIAKLKVFIMNSSWFLSYQSLTGTFDDSDLTFYYCTKPTGLSDSGESWPRGNYCILRASGPQCPSGKNIK